MSDIDRKIDELYKVVRNNSRVILYNDAIGRPDEDGRREQVSRDDMWAISTEELNSILALIDEARVDEVCYSVNQFEASPEYAERRIAELKPDTTPGGGK